jgi:uncharacterized protein YegJ (DUF2314 family)
MWTVKHVIATMALAALAGCKNAPREGAGAQAAGSADERAAPTAPTATPTPGTAAAPGTLRGPAYLMYLVIAPAGAPVADLRARATKDLAAVGLAITAETDPLPRVEVVTPPLADLELSRESIAYLVGEVPETDYDAIEKAAGVVAILVETDAMHALELMAKAGTVARDLAAACKGWIFVPGAGALYRADRFAEYLAGVGSLDVRRLMVVHFVAGEGDLPTIDTVGMNQLGLPELMVRDVPSQVSDQALIAVNATAQVLANGGDLSRAGAIDLDLAALGGEWMKGITGTGKLTWRVRWSAGMDEPADPDPDARLELELDVAGSTAGSSEALVAVLGAFAGIVEQNMVSVADDDPELLAAAERARKELVALAPRMAKGVPPGEVLSVKAKFTGADDAVEWMWIDVVSYRGDTFVGTLANQPRMETDLELGQRVTAKLADVADYVHVDKAGKETGNYSSEIFRRRGL